MLKLSAIQADRAALPTGGVSFSARLSLDVPDAVRVHCNLSARAQIKRVKLRKALFCRGLGDFWFRWFFCWCCQNDTWRAHVEALLPPLGHGLKNIFCN